MTSPAGRRIFGGRRRRSNASLMLTSVLSNADYRVMVVDLLNGFQKDHGTNWSANHFNDDCMWASIAFARGQLVSGHTRFGDIARWNFDRVYARAWDTNLNGGLYWTTDNHSKNAKINGPAGYHRLVDLLYQICGDTGYLTKARDIYAWERSVLFDPGTGAVSDAIGLQGRIHSWTSTYNQGTFIGLANFLGQTNDATLAADFTRDHLTDSGILTQYGTDGNNSGFNAIFFRWMTRFMRDRGLQGTYESWLRANAVAAWKVRRTTDGLSWCQWRELTPGGHQFAFLGLHCLTGSCAKRYRRPAYPIGVRFRQSPQRVRRENDSVNHTEK